MQQGRAPSRRSDAETNEWGPTRDQEWVIGRAASLRTTLRGLLVALCLATVLLSSASALADSAGILPFSSGKGVPQGAAENIASLVSTEVDIRGGYDLVLSAADDEVAAGCGERSACVDEYGRANSFSHVVTGSVSSAGSKRYTLVLTLYKMGSAAAVRQVLNTMSRSPDSLLNGIPDLVVELLTGQRPVHEEDKPSNDRNSKAGLFTDGDEFGDDENLGGSEQAGSNGETDGEDRKWMERDRNGRLTQPTSGEEDPLGLDDLDLDLDLDLDELSSDHQVKKRKERGEREAKARAAHAEEERLAEIAAQERQPRKQEREDERLEREEERRIVEERARRSDQEQSRIRKDERRRREREQTADDERRERQRKRAQDDDLRQQEQERREAEADERKESERRDARARFEEDRLSKERARREDRESERASYSRDDEDEGEGPTLDAGIIIIESDDGEGEDEGGDFGILIEEDDDDDEPAYNRGDDERDDENERDYESASDYKSERDNEDERDDYEEINIDRRGNRGSLRDQSKRDSSSGYGSARPTPERSDVPERLAIGRNSRGSARSQSPKTSSGRPPGAIRAFVGYNNYYLSFLKMGVEGSIYILPALSLDLGVEAWMLWLREGEDLHLAARVLPNFLIGASYRMRFHPVIMPFVGGDVGTVIYAQKVEIADNEIIAKTPLFALVVAAKGGCEFNLPKNFALFLSLRVGVSISGDLEQDGLADIQQYVNETWSPTRVFFNIGAGAMYRF